MSHTNVYELYSTKTKLISELQNGYGSGPAIWAYVSEKLTGKRFNYFDTDNFWPLWKDERLNDKERAVLLSTYDGSFVEIGRLPEFSDAAREVSELIIKNTSWDWNHFYHIGCIARELFIAHDYRCKGLCIGCTSISDPWESDEIRNMDTWGVYELIGSLKQ